MNDELALSPPHPEIPPGFLEQHWPLLVFGIPAAVLLLAAIALVVWLVFRSRGPMQEPPAVVARRELEMLRGRETTPAEAAAIAQVARRYLIARFRLREGELTTRELGDRLRQVPELGSTLANDAAAFLARCDEMKFSAGGATDGSLAGRALELIDACEQRQASLREAADKAPPVYS